MGSIISHRVDYGGVGGSERPAAHFQKKIDPGNSPGLGPREAFTASCRARLFAVRINYPYLRRKRVFTQCGLFYGYPDGCELMNNSIMMEYQSTPRQKTPTWPQIARG